MVFLILQHHRILQDLMQMDNIINKMDILPTTPDFLCIVDAL